MHSTMHEAHTKNPHFLYQTQQKQLITADQLKQTVLFMPIDRLKAKGGKGITVEGRERRRNIMIPKMQKEKDSERITR